MKIVSGGQTGVDRAALDVALELGLPVGGWCPRGRRAEDGSLDARYPLRETPSVRYSQRTLWNVRDSDGTLVLTVGELMGGTALTVKLAERLGKPHVLFDLNQQVVPATVTHWITQQKLNVLNIAGPRESQAPGIYKWAKNFLGELLRNIRERQG